MCILGIKTNILWVNKDQTCSKSDLPFLVVRREIPSLSSGFTVTPKVVPAAHEYIEQLVAVQAIALGSCHSQVGKKLIHFDLI